jgi:serine/threonine-protein kinase HipA
MKNDKCLVCYQPLDADSINFHTRCCKNLFGTATAPLLPYSLDQMYELANEVVRRSVTVTGVQAKLSMDIETYKETKKGTRFTIVGLWGGYILKPPSELYNQLPEIEDVTMHLAEIIKIKTVAHSLIRLSSGELAYITKRIDRANNRKLAMEDMCQLTERLTEDKYKGSMEQIGKIVGKYSANSGFDVLELFEVTLFSFLTGNADMHLKNFSLIREFDGSLVLSPAYDLVATKLVIPKDEEETALTINGKKRNLTLNDFKEYAKSLAINEKTFQNSLEKFQLSISLMLDFVDSSFLTSQSKGAYKQLIVDRARAINLKLI